MKWLASLIKFVLRRSFRRVSLRTVAPTITGLRYSLFKNKTLKKLSLKKGIKKVIKKVISWIFDKILISAFFKIKLLFPFERTVSPKKPVDRLLQPH